MIEGDYRALRAVWEVYGWEEDEEAAGEDDEGEAWPTPPVPAERPAGGEVVKRLRDALATP